MLKVFKIFYRSIPSNTPKTLLLQALDSSTAQEMFKEKYRVSDLEVPPVDKIQILDSQQHCWREPLPPPNAKNNI